MSLRRFIIGKFNSSRINLFPTLDYVQVIQRHLETLLFSGQRSLHSPVPIVHKDFAFPHSPFPARRPSGFIQPCLPTVSRTVPTGPQWAYEIKHDGFRFICHRDGERVRVFSRGGHDWRSNLPAVVEAMRAFPVTSVTLDGEVVICGADDVSQFDRMSSVFGHRGSRAVAPPMNRKPPPDPTMTLRTCGAKLKLVRASVAAGRIRKTDSSDRTRQRRANAANRV
jgi:hypothetical protein